MASSDGASTESGLLVVRINPASHIEAEFNDWYDTEHVPERLAVPGFSTASRFAGGEHFRYATLYDLASPGVLSSPQYRVFFDGARRTPWTARVGRHLTVDRRAYRQVSTPRLQPIRADHLHLVLRSVEVEPSAVPDFVSRVAAHRHAFADQARLEARVFVGIEQTEGFATKITQRPVAAERDLLVCYTAADYTGVAHAMSDGLGGSAEVHRRYRPANHEAR